MVSEKEVIQVKTVFVLNSIALHIPNLVLEQGTMDLFLSPIVHCLMANVVHSSLWKVDVSMYQRKKHSVVELVVECFNVLITLFYAACDWENEAKEAWNCQFPQ